MNKNDNNLLFCKQYSLKMIFIFFLIGSLIGTYYEEILHLISHHEFELRQGVLWGPFNPIYGIGFANFIIFLVQYQFMKVGLRRNLVQSILIL